MDNPESTERPPEAGGRRRWPIAVAILALGVAMFSLATLRSSDTPAQTGDVDLAALSQRSPLAVPIYQRLSQQGGAAPAAAGATSVEAMDYKFAPASAKIAVGDTVTWTNHDSAPHNVVVTDGPEKFSSPLLQQGQSFSHTFTQAGTYSYYCSVHPDMKATLTVEGSSTPPTTAPPTTPPGSDPTTPPSTDPTPPTHTMPPTTPAPGGPCVPKAVLQPIIDHIKTAHLETSLGQQVQDILNLDQHLKTHTVWLETVLKPVFDGSVDKVLVDTLKPILDHIKTAHLETPLGQQVADLLNLDQYLKTHTVWLENVLTPLLGQATC
ncbi:cupredoxin domain-containing protein [Amycolatopsis anabasis]|uniref:cupredoxin domain-containing protein n=1 Tax=Amycolatopsis anabasis TaxID=1840409 RepID=UPI00131D3703|nr:cupredoxin family copper-binding protein [Amycolatopsis anabasis]